MSAPLAEQILQTLQRRQHGAAFVSELAAVVGPSAPAAVEEAIRSLDEQRRILVADHAAPDVHLESVDLRVVAYVRSSEDEPASEDEPRAAEAAEAVWSEWLRAFLATHRC